MRWPSLRQVSSRSAITVNCPMPMLSSICCLILTGWLDLPCHIPCSVCHYCYMTNDLSVPDGILLKGHWSIISITLHDLFLKNVHEGYLGILTCQQATRNTNYWSGDDINKCYMKHCPLCIRIKLSRPVQYFLNHEDSQSLWQKGWHWLLQVGW